MDIKFTKPFGPDILETQLDNSLIDDINSFVDYKIQHGYEDWSYNLVGRNSIQAVLPYDFMQSSGLEAVILSLASQYFTKNNLQEDPVLLDAWVNDCQPLDYNPVHFHHGEVSGIIYLKMPTIEVGVEGKTQFIYGDALRFSDNIHSVFPKPGTLLLFPSWLMHTAYPYTQSGARRRTASFNVYTKNKVKTNAPTVLGDLDIRY